MKKTSLVPELIAGFSFVGIFLFNTVASAQDSAKTGTAIPEDVNKIVTASCTPCHTSNGGLMSRAKLNLTEWTNYSPEKQKEKAAKMYSEVNKGAMPPKMAREKKPELIPTKEQTEIIKKWSESFPTVTK
jgi:mono/diheme cytochrome c family protein